MSTILTDGDVGSPPLEEDIRKGQDKDLGTWFVDGQEGLAISSVTLCPNFPKTASVYSSVLGDYQQCLFSLSKSTQLG